MHDDKRYPFVDELLEASLKQYRGEEPRTGLEMRILAEVRSRQRAARRRWLVWTVAVCAGMLATIVSTLHFVRTPPRQPTPSASLPPKESGAHRAPLQPPQQRPGRAAAPRSRPEQFPTPLPLTEQEKLLLAYVSKAGKAGLVEGANTTDESPITELTISAIKIAPVEIEPLDDSQSEQEK